MNKKPVCSTCLYGDDKWQEGRALKGYQHLPICPLCEADGWKVATSLDIVNDPEFSHMVDIVSPIEVREGWRSRFYDTFVQNNVWQGEDEYTKNVAIGNIENFITTELERAKAEEWIKGRKEEHGGCSVGCPLYSSGHSIDVNGNCNKGCC